MFTKPELLRAHKETALNPTEMFRFQLNCILGRAKNQKQKNPSEIIKKNCLMVTKATNARNRQQYSLENVLVVCS